MRRCQNTSVGERIPAESKAFVPPPASEIHPPIPLEQRKPFLAKNKLAEPQKILSLARFPPER